MITSVTNSRARLLRSLASPRGRAESGLFLAEGTRLVAAGLQFGLNPVLALVDPQCVRESSASQVVTAELFNRAEECEEASSKVLDSISDVRHHQGVVAAFRIGSFHTPSKRTKGALLDAVIVLDGVTDPGNAGTVLRSSAAAGVRRAILTSGCVDPYNPKVVRAGAGAHFVLEISTAFRWPELTSHTPSLPPLYLADAHRGKPQWEVDWRAPFGLVIGSEAHGHSLAAKKAAEGFVRIPQPGAAESLNAAVASAIVLFEAVRQRIQGSARS
ncbi:MAG: RNA methyltransferase [Chloroflexi bacterium]|nr:RNA methyltransferase [Chloroflexota bacterium]